MNTHSYTKDDGTHVVHYAARDAQEHHMIPRQLRDHPMVTSSAYNIESESNLMFLPTGRSGMGSNPEGHSIHLGSHPKYTEELKYELDISHREADRYDYSQKERLEQVQDIALQAQSWLTQGDEDGDPYRLNARQDCWDSPPEGVELDRSLIFGLNVGSKLQFAFSSIRIGDKRQKNLAHEIDGIIRNRETPWMSLINIKNRYMVVESSCHDTLIADAFLRIDYAMKMLNSCAQLMLPYDLITEARVQKQCEILESVKDHKISIETAIQSLKDIGFVDVDYDDELHKKCMDDREAYYKARDTEEEELIRKNGARTMWGLTVRAKLVGLEQDVYGTLRSHVFTYINAFQQFSSGAAMGETSFDTQYLQSMLEYLQAQKDLKQAFIIVKRVATLFPFIEHLIRQHKKLAYSSERLAEYSPPQTPRRVPVAIRYGDLIDNPNQKIISVYGGVQLTHERVNVIQVAYLPKHLTRLVKFRIENQEQEERQMYELAISNLKKPRQDTLSCIDPSLIEAVQSEWAKAQSDLSKPSEVRFGYEDLRLEDKTPQTVKPTPVATPKEVTVLIPEPVKKEPEKQKKNSCCVVM